jgi:hypothetical protein
LAIKSRAKLESVRAGRARACLWWRDEAHTGAVGGVAIRAATSKRLATVVPLV